MEKVLLATDLDRTLLDDNSQVPEECLEAIRRFTQAGGLFTVATGRPTRGALRYPELISLVNAPIISYNGGCIYDTKAHRILWQKYLPDGLAPVIRSALDLYPQVGALVFRGSEDLTTVTQPNARTTQVTWLREKYQTAEVPLEDCPYPWNKIVMAGEAEYMAPCTEYIRRSVQCPLSVILTEGIFMEINAEGIEKGAALRKVAEIMNVEQKHVIAIGDSMNDIEMIQWAGIGAAVANAEPALLACQPVIFPSNTELGIVHCIDALAMPMLKTEG